MAKMKYHSTSFVNALGRWDSKLEYHRYLILRVREEKKAIQDLKRQVPFTLVPTQYEKRVTVTKTGLRRESTTVVERAVEYKADFTYIKDGKLVVEDTKSPATRTKDYVIKRKLMRYMLNIKIKEVTKPTEE